MSIKTIECHDCGIEIKIKDQFEELSMCDIKYCPVCGGKNIEVNESK